MAGFEVSTNGRFWVSTEAYHAFLSRMYGKLGDAARAAQHLQRGYELAQQSGDEVTVRSIEYLRSRDDSSE